MRALRCSAVHTSSMLTSDTRANGLPANVSAASKSIDPALGHRVWRPWCGDGLASVSCELARSLPAAMHREDFPRGRYGRNWPIAEGNDRGRWDELSFGRCFPGDAPPASIVRRRARLSHHSPCQRPCGTNDFRGTTWRRRFRRQGTSCRAASPSLRSSPGDVVGAPSSLASSTIWAALDRSDSVVDPGTSRVSRDRSNYVLTDVRWLTMVWVDMMRIIEKGPAWTPSGSTAWRASCLSPSRGDG